jgi:hypothetical protein
MTVNLNQIALLNQSPLNRACATQLRKTGWGAGDSMLNSLALALWGITEAGIKVEPLAPDHPSTQGVESQIRLLASLAPPKAMRFLEEESAITPDDIGEAATPEEASALIIQEIYSTMVYQAP